MATLTGTDGDDNITGYVSSNDSISGGAGNDYLSSYYYFGNDNFADTLDGGEGNDTLYGNINQQNG